MNLNDRFGHVMLENLQVGSLNYFLSIRNRMIEVRILYENILILLVYYVYTSKFT